MRTLNLKGILCLAAVLAFSQISRAQVSNVSIGTEAIKNNAILWLKSNGNQGLLLPVIANRSSFTGLNNTEDKGMLVYDASDNKVYFWNGSAWIEAGGGSGGGSNQTLTLSGNTFTLSGSPASNVNLSTPAPASGQPLVWNGTQWVATSLAGDVTGTVGATVISGLKGKAIPGLPSTTNALVYDGAAWTFQPLSSAGEANTASNVGTGGQGVFKQKSALNLEFYKINAGSNKVSVALDATNNEIDIDINSLNLVVAATQVTGLGTLATLSAITSAQITDGSITSADILDGEIRNADILDGAVTGNKLSIPGASTGQVLKYNGSTWTAQADDVGAGATPTLSNGQLLTGNGTANSATTVTGDIALSGGAMTIKTNVVTTGMIQNLAVDGTKLADNSVSSAKISDGTITSADILDAAITSLDIANGAVATVDVLDAAITTPKILDGAVTGAKIATTGAGVGQVLKYNGTTWLPQDDDTGSSITLANGQLLTGNGTTNSATTITGDIALSGGAMTIKTNVVTTGMIQNLAVDGTKLADNSVNSAKITDGSITNADILDATIGSLDIANSAIATIDIADGAVTGAKISTTGATSGQVLKYNGTTWLPQDDNTGSGFSTANEVPRGNGTTLVSSNIYSNGTSVGIGTNAPRSVLELVNGNLILSGSAGAPDDPVDIDFKTHSSTNLFKAKIWTDPGSNTLWFSTSQASPFRKDITIDPNGNVGIGATSPIAKFDVEGSGRILDNLGLGSNTSPLSTLKLYIEGTASPTNPEGLAASEGQIRIVRPATGGVKNANTAEIKLSTYESGITGRTSMQFWLSGLPNNENGFGTVAEVPVLTLHGEDGGGGSNIGRVGIGRAPTTNVLEVEGEASKQTSGSWAMNSDRRIKTDIKDIEHAIETVKKLRPVTYRYTDEWLANRPSIKDRYYYSFIAQEFQTVFPESVRGSGEYLDSDPQEILQIDPYNAEIVTIKAVQELIQKVEFLEKENENLKAEKGFLESRLNSVEDQQKSLQEDVDELKRILGLIAERKVTKN